MTQATVYYSGSLKDYLEIQDESVVIVTDTPPEKFEVLVKCHPHLDDLTENDDGSYSAKWEVLNKYPIEKRIN